MNDLGMERRNECMQGRRQERKKKGKEVERIRKYIYMAITPQDEGDAKRRWCQEQGYTQDQSCCIIEVGRAAEGMVDFKEGLGGHGLR